ncbi:hypothetical protein KJ570_02755 [Patescibacteria group bacterium]|nr:hypothetical protein [Patescibacteria group bacterium]MBU2035899.1 hypothetical protein [Patescibacteria group bacterium]
MLGYLDREGKRMENPKFSAGARILRKLNGGKDIPFPTSEQTLSLEEATSEYKNKPTNSELLTQFMRSFWQEAGQRIEKNIIVDKFPLTAKEILEKRGKGYMAIFVPEGVNRVDLGKMFSKMKSCAVQKENSVEEAINNSGWLWVEVSVDAPNRNTTQRELKEKFKKERKQGQSLITYIIGGQISKLLTGEYFDEGSTWSRLLGSCHRGGVFCAAFRPDDGLNVSSHWNPGYFNESMGGRSEKVIKP